MSEAELEEIITRIIDSGLPTAMRAQARIAQAVADEIEIRMMEQAGELEEFDEPDETYYCYACKSPVLKTDKFCHKCARPIIWYNGHVI